MWKIELVIGYYNQVNFSKVEVKAAISIFPCMLSHEEGRGVFEKTVHAMGNDHSDFFARHSRPFLNSVFSSDFVCALHR